MTPFAVFLVSKIGNQFVGTTRTDGKLGLAGGKVDQGETPQQALIRESNEEGWLLPSDVQLTLIHQQEVDGKLCQWFQSDKSPVRLTSYKEMRRGIKPILMNQQQLIDSGMGNDICLTKI
jgi:8-oxo-dGTP pyrophosphatase MutT (NUDIX family)